LVATAWPLPADEPSTVFAHSGQELTLSLEGEISPRDGAVLLSAYGRSWGEAARMEGGRVQLVAPSVRSPVVFRLVFVGAKGAVVGELVVYPEGWVSWDKDERLPQVKETQFVAVNAPAWFESWADAVGLAVEEMPGAESLASRHWRTPEKPSLLILGRKAAGAGPTDTAKLAALYRSNVLVLEADWFGKPVPDIEAIEIHPKHARAALADLQSQNWALPASFRGSAEPWPDILNRRSWIDGGEYPAVEEIRTGEKRSESLRIVLSYLPWQDQLGRCEVADELLLRVLSETAQGVKEVERWDGRWCLLYPAVEKIKKDRCPVLAAALKSVEEKSDTSTATPAGARRCGVRGYVLDLRGSTAPENLLDELDVERAVEPRIRESVPLLILGDSPLLDSWRWLKRDRQKSQSLRPGVIWWPDSTLPPSLSGELRLMGLLTEWDVFLGEHPGEKDNGNGEYER
jgi:hypothetical protein